MTDHPHATVFVKTATGATVRAAVPDAMDGPLRGGDAVLVQLDGAPAIGRVMRMPTMMCARGCGDTSTRLLRRATQQDVLMRQRHAQRERDARRVATMKVQERGLVMKLVRVEQAFDGSRLVFYFTADERVDFRELVRELASEFKTRIELRQIGVRDEAKLMAGYGTCGRPLCCAAFLKAFDPVSIKMAKLQDLALNPARLSGLCGRLKCCLRYELLPSQLPRTKDVRDDEPAGEHGQGADHGPRRGQA